MGIPGDVLAIAFPRIDPSLLLGPGAAGSWARARGFTAPRRYVHRLVPAGDGLTVGATVYGPDGSRWVFAIRRAARASPERLEAFRLGALGLSLRPIPLRQELMSPAFLTRRWLETGVVPYEHQLATARRVLFDLGGRAILADEVGLGKTIEAGLVLHELLLRRLVMRALILVPSGLGWQWYKELRDKFDLPVELQGSERDWQRVPLLIGSIDTAKRPPHREEILAQPYDLVIVDEAHRLKNGRTRAAELVASIRSRYLLLVTATPVHNHAGELWSLVRLVYPPIEGRAAPPPRRPLPGDPAARALASDARRVMVRHRRAQTPIPFTARHLHTVPVRLTASEKSLYADLDAAMLHGAGGGPGAPSREVLAFLTLKRELCSSPAALAASLRRMVARGKGHLAEMAGRAQRVAPWAKAGAAARLVRRLGDEHVLIFTEYVATQRALADVLARLGRPVVLFHGGLSAMQRDWARGVFERHAPVMVSTDAGAEGVNLQFCRHLVNIDLPWNPMRIEQRIGRLHRLGQRREVHVWNLVAAGTIEEYVLYLLVQKLDLFRRFVGELDAVVEELPQLGRLERDLARVLAQASTRALSPEEIQVALEQLAEAWQRTARRLNGGHAGDGTP